MTDDVRAPVDGFETGRAQWRWRVESTQDREFLRCGGEAWTFGEFDDVRRRVAAGLASLGVGAGTRVAVGLVNRVEMVAVQMALQELGAVTVPLVPGLTFAELAHPIRHSGSTYLVVDDAVAGELVPRLDELPAFRAVVAADELEVPPGVPVVRYREIAGSPPLPPVEVTGEDRRTLSMVLYTSGSTGRPKGVMIGAGSLATVGQAFALKFGLRSDDNFILPSTLAHALGALTGIGIAVFAGSRLTLVDHFSPTSFWPQVLEHGATTTILFPAQCNLLLETSQDAPAPGEHPLRLVITHAYLRRFRQRFGVPLATVWGMTETGAICTGSEPGYEGELGESYVGTAMHGAEVATFDEEFRRLPPGEPGELCLRHPTVMLGYLDQPDETAATLVDGWIRSGDRGVVDAEGRAFFGGRFKNVIKRSGENISAEEVEAALDEHPAVAESCVFGVPDPLRTEEVATVVVLRPGASAAPDELRDACRDRLVRWKLPRYVSVRTDALPRLANGKIDRVALRDAFDPLTAWDAERPG